MEPGLGLGLAWPGLAGPGWNLAWLGWAWLAALRGMRESKSKTFFKIVRAA